MDEVMRGDPGVSDLASKVLAEMATYLGAHVGAFYVVEEGNGPALSLAGSYAYTTRKKLSNVFKPGEGLVGQAALERKVILVHDVPDDYVRVTSGLGERAPRVICVAPFLHEGRVKGVVELGSLQEFTGRELEYLAQATPPLAGALLPAADPALR